MRSAARGRDVRQRLSPSQVSPQLSCSVVGPLWPVQHLRNVLNPSRLPLPGGDWASDGLRPQRLGGSGQKAKGHQRAQADSEPSHVCVGVATLPPPCSCKEFNRLPRRGGLPSISCHRGWPDTPSTPHAQYGTETSQSPVVMVRALAMVCAHVQETVECGVEGGASVPPGSTGVLRGEVECSTCGVHDSLCGMSAGWVRTSC